MDTLERRDDAPGPGRRPGGHRPVVAHGVAGEGCAPRRDGDSDAASDHDDDEGWAPISEVIRAAGITEAMVYRLITRGVLDARRPPRRGGDPGRGRARVSRASLAAYLDARETRDGRRSHAPRWKPCRRAPDGIRADAAAGRGTGAGAPCGRDGGRAQRRVGQSGARRVASARCGRLGALRPPPRRATLRRSGRSPRPGSSRRARPAGAPARTPLHPSRRAATRWVRALEDTGKKPATVQLKLAAARALYAALRWAGATDAAPFAGVRAAPEKTAPWDRRKPYPPADVERLLAAATGEDRALVLLGAHAGLRVSEALALRHADVRLSDGELDVRDGKGGKARTVPVSESLASALREVAHTDSQDSREDGHAEGRVLRLRDDRQARLRLRRLTVAAGVPYRGYHALRHYCGTRLMRDTGDLDTVARVLGHSSIETARVYAKWSDQGAKTAIGRW